ncbi:hypothetical protein ACVILI_005987 [Mesorhizobium sp. USDA 4775]
MAANGFWKFSSENWERIVFSVVGLILIAYSLRLVYADQIANGGIVFGLGFLSFIYANVSRFKRFKGLGFEAELWEDKQKEAADLIERLKNVVAIYTREVILGRVKAGRMANGVDWRSHWQLYDDLVTQHSVLGQKIDFSGVKKVMDDYFLFDMSMPLVNHIRKQVDGGRAKAMRKIDEEFGSPVKDVEGYNKRIAAYHEIVGKIDDPFKISASSNLGGHLLTIWHDAKARLGREFDVEIELEPDKLGRLQRISALYESRPVEITDELIGWTALRD